MQGTIQKKSARILQKLLDNAFNFLTGDISEIAFSKNRLDILDELKKSDARTQFEVAKVAKDLNIWLVGKEQEQ